MAYLGGLLGSMGGIGRRNQLGSGAQGIMPGDQPGLEEWLRAAQQGGMQQQEPMATRQGGGLFGGAFNKANIGDTLNNLGTSFAQAGAMMSGEWDSAANIAQNRAQLQGLRAKQMAEADQQKQMLEALKAQGLTDQQAMLVLGNAGSLGDFREKPPETPGFIRDAQAYNALPDDQKRQVQTYMDMSNPRYTNTPQGTQFIPRTQIPDGLTPMTSEEVQRMGLQAGGPTQPASGGFRRYRR